MSAADDVPADQTDTSAPEPSVADSPAADPPPTPASAVDGGDGGRTTATTTTGDSPATGSEPPAEPDARSRPRPPRERDTANTPGTANAADTEDTDDTEDVNDVNVLGPVSGSTVMAGGMGNAAVTMNLGRDRQAVIQRVPLDAAVTARLRRLHQPVPEQDEMAAELWRNHLLVLSGRDGSGRESTSRVLLAEVCGDDALHRLHGADDNLLQALVEQGRRYFKDGRGILVDLGPRRPGRHTLTALSDLARAQRTYVVLTVDDNRTTPADPGPYAVRHQRPPLRPVLETHLRAALNDHGTSCTRQDGCAPEDRRRFVARVLEDARLESELVAAPSVRYVVDFVRNLVSCLHQPPEALHPLFGGLPSLAGRVLQMAPQGANADGSQPGLDPYHRSLRIAYVLFYDLPLSDVLMAGTLLSAEVLHAERRETPPTRPVFDLDLDELVAPGTGIAATPTDREPDNPRRARLAHKGLMPALVEAVWHKPGWLREPLELWLKVLAESGLERVRTRAAEITGLLLCHDFDSVYRNLVGPWARGSVKYRRLAAVALTTAVIAEDTGITAKDPRLAAQVQRQVRDWSRSPDPRLQDSAARAYGTRVGTQNVTASLSALQELGGRPALVPFASVASSTAALYFADGGAEPVTRELGRWIRSYNHFLPRHAVRTLLGLGPFVAGPDLPARPTLAHQAMTNPEHEETLLLLWRLALVDPAHSAQAWNLLHDWLLVADEDDELAAFLEKFVRRLCEPERRGRAGLHHRTVFRLRQWCRRLPTPKCALRLLQGLTGE